MNRDHVGMIFRFLPKEEQEELSSLESYRDREYFSTTIGKWISCDITDVYRKLDSCVAYRPKGFLSWAEIEEDVIETLADKDLWISISGPYRFVKFGIQRWDNGYQNPYVTLKQKGVKGVDDYSLSLTPEDNYGFRFEEPK